MRKPMMTVVSITASALLAVAGVAPAAAARAPASARTLTWSVVHSPNRRAHGNLLDAVSCVSPVACTAVGNYASSTGVARTLAESWDGSRWSLVRSPNVGRFGSQLVAVSCVSANACMAVGFTQGRSRRNPGRVLGRLPLVGTAHPQPG